MAATRSGLSLRNRYFLILDLILFTLPVSFSYVLRLETFNLQKCAQMAEATSSAALDGPYGEKPRRFIVS